MRKSEVVVIFTDAQAPDAGFESTAGPDARLASILSQFKARLSPVFAPESGGGELEIFSPDAQAEQSRYQVALVGKGAEEMAAKLRALPQVEAAYVKPPVSNPLAPGHRIRRKPPHDNANELLGAPAVLTDFRAQQVYLDAAPNGVDVAAAWAKSGGKGKGVRVIDIEGGWCFTHVDLKINSGGLKAGTAFADMSWRNHGTAVLGEIGGDANGIGITGIAPEAIVSTVSHGSLGSAGAIAAAASMLRAGDVMLLEMHRPGPRFNFDSRADQRGFIAVEWWPDDFLAIQKAVARGIIVVEAAGNGGENFDDPFYNTPDPAFPASWKNPLGGARDSGAIMVGAGAPAGGAHGPPRSRLNFSNHGKRVDCQGWGRGVVTTGYGDLASGVGENEFFTATFSGTSSASPIVTGVVTCLSGIVRAKGKKLQPADVRTLLRKTGQPQQASPSAPISQNIGKQPDLAQLVPAV